MPADPGDASKAGMASSSGRADRRGIGKALIAAAGALSSSIRARVYFTAPAQLDAMRREFICTSKRALASASMLCSSVFKHNNANFPVEFVGIHRKTRFSRFITNRHFCYFGGSVCCYDSFSYHYSH